jgi:hypothetical protein
MGRALTAGATDVAGDDVVGAKGFEPAVPAPLIVVHGWLAMALMGIA